MCESLHLQREALARSIERRPICRPRTRIALLLAILVGCTGTCLSHADAGKDTTQIQEVVVRAQRQAADEQITRQVQEALSADPWIYSEHVAVTTKNGVVRVEGIVQDTAELFRILHLARKIPGTRRVYSALEILHNDPDGG